MKKTTTFIRAMVFCLCMTLPLCGCDMLNFSDEKITAQKNMNLFVDCLDKRDHNGIKALFAPNRIADIADFDENITEMLNLYKGEFISHDFQEPPMTEYDVNGGNKWRRCVIGGNITTTKEVYRVIMYWCDTDTADSGNVGIWSLYIFNKKDNPLDDYTFYGSEPWGSELINGIYVVKPYKYIDMTMNIFQSKNSENVGILFAPDVVNKNTSFYEDTQKFFAYYTGKFTKCTQRFADEQIQTNSNGQVTQRFRMFSYAIDASDGTYLLAVKYCDKDAANENNRGMHSVYIKKADPSLAPYWGDGTWRKGINIDTDDAA